LYTLGRSVCMALIKCAVVLVAVVDALNATNVGNNCVQIWFLLQPFCA
jgi:hypothetical protein